MMAFTNRLGAAKVPQKKKWNVRNLTRVGANTFAVCFHILAADKWASLTKSGSVSDSSSVDSVVTKDSLYSMLQTTVSAVNKLLHTKVKENEQELSIRTLVNEAFDHYAKSGSDKM